MNNQPQQEKKSSFFFAYGSPQFVIGATLVNALLNADEEDGDNLFAGIIAILSMLFMIILFGCIGLRINHALYGETVKPKNEMSINIKNNPGPKGWDDLSMMGKKKQHKRNETKTFGEVKLETINEEQQ
jgi:hypothetical protein